MASQRPFKSGPRGAAVLATHVPIAVPSASHLSLDAFRPDMAAILAAAGERPAA